MGTEAGIINNAIELLNGLLPGGVESVTYMGVGQCWDDTNQNVPAYLYRATPGCGSYCPVLSYDECKEKALGLNNAIGFGLNGKTPMTYDQGEDLASGKCHIYFSKLTTDCDGAEAVEQYEFGHTTLSASWLCAG